MPVRLIWPLQYVRLSNRSVAIRLRSFWTDGLLDETANVESVRSIRRQVLIALGRSARAADVVGADMLFEELTRGMGVAISLEVLLDHLGKFVIRGVLLEVERSRV